MPARSRANYSETFLPMTRGGETARDESRRRRKETPGRKAILFYSPRNLPHNLILRSERVIAHFANKSDRRQIVDFAFRCDWFVVSRRQKSDIKVKPVCTIALGI